MITSNSIYVFGLILCIGAGLWLCFTGEGLAGAWAFTSGFWVVSAWLRDRNAAEWKRKYYEEKRKTYYGEGKK